MGVLISLFFGLVIGIGAGWYLCRKFGAKAQAVVDAVEKKPAG